ncbi:unnamed protein product, partial [Tetraodon nigroviridis]
VDNAKVLHYVGAGIAFPTSMLFVCLQSALTYRLAKTQGEHNVAPPAALPGAAGLCGLGAQYPPKRPLCPGIVLSPCCCCP